MTKTNKNNYLISNDKSGFAIMVALVIGTVLLILSISLYSFMGHQRTGINAIVNGEVAHFLAEAGISSSIRSVRDTLDFSSNSVVDDKLKTMLMIPGKFADLNLNSILEETWNKDLKKFAAEVDKKALIEVNVWLRDFKQLETDSKYWVDNIAREGWLSIESTGTYKGFSRTSSVKRKIKVCNVLPPVLSKFTLHISDAAGKNEGKFNIIRNDYKGMTTDGPQPLICYNHSTPDALLNARNPSDISKDEMNNEIWKKRGWIWLGGKKTRLNLSSGAGDNGEIFQFYDVSNINIFTPIKFITHEDALPISMLGIKNMFWDISSTIRKAQYSFGHSFIIDGFHDKSNRKDTAAMYEGHILSNSDRLKYSSKSSILHLYGDARKGYQSRTKIIGNVNLAIARLSSLNVKPEDADVANIFNKTNPPPLYLLPSVSNSQYENSSFMITDIIEMLGGQKRSVGGPIIQPNMLFGSYKNYAKLMSGIIELPYVTSYSTMQDIASRKEPRIFPASSILLNADNGSKIEIKRNDKLLYSGSVAVPKLFSVINGRIQEKSKSIKEFWSKYLNKNNELELNSIVKIENLSGQDLVIPPLGIATPLIVKGGGMIISDSGNLIIRGVKLSSNEALSIVAKNAKSVRFDSAQTNMVNIIAPNAELSYSSRLDLYGILCIKSVFVDHRFQGGKIRFREEQDPTSTSYDKFYKIQIAEKDSFWYE